MKRAYILLMVFLNIFSTKTIYADVIETRDGMLLNGTILKEDEKEIVFKSNFGDIKIEKKNIDQLVKIKNEQESLETYNNLKRQQSQNKENIYPSVFNPFKISGGVLWNTGSFSALFKRGSTFQFGTRLNFWQRLGVEKKQYHPSLSILIPVYYFSTAEKQLFLTGLALGPSWDQKLSYKTIYFVFTESIQFAPMYGYLKTPAGFLSFPKALILPGLSFYLHYKKFLIGISGSYSYIYDGFISIHGISGEIVTGIYF